MIWLETLFLGIFFIFGAVMGSFYHVVATRLSKDESIIYPGSPCVNCNHKLKWYENIPIISFIILKGKCSSCGSEIPLSCLIVEIVTGLLFAVCFHVFKMSFDLIISLIFISSLIIIIVSDIEYMIILDEVLVVSTFIIIILYLIHFVVLMDYKVGLKELMFEHVYPGVGAFICMYSLKLMGDKLFKKESLGGGDIKLMFLFGLVLGLPLAICTIFLATFIAFPIALIMLFMNKDNIIPFGPFLSMSAIIILISRIDIMDVINFLIK